MKRPIGLILSAIVLSLAALFLLLLSVVSVFTSVFASRQPSTAAMPHFVTYLFVALSIFYAALGVWAILTVIGILRLRAWARYSILIIGGGLAVTDAFAAFGTLVGRTMLPTLEAQQPAADPRVMSMVFFVLAAAYLLVAAVGIWWLIYFNLRPVRELFSNQAMPVPSSGIAISSFSKAPTAIKIIGGFLLFSAVCCLLFVFLPFPAFLLGFIVPPAAAHVLYLCFAALAALMGYGLLKLKESARLTTIAFLILGYCNILLSVLPWYQTQFRTYMTKLAASMPTIPGQSPALIPFGWTLILASCIFGFLLNGFVLWLLHRHRAAFQTPPPAELMLEA